VRYWRKRKIRPLLVVPDNSHKFNCKHINIAIINPLSIYRTCWWRKEAPNSTKLTFTELGELPGLTRGYSYLSWSSKSTVPSKSKVWESASVWLSNSAKSSPRMVLPQSNPFARKTTRGREEKRSIPRSPFYSKNQPTSITWPRISSSNQTDHQSQLMAHYFYLYIFKRVRLRVEELVLSKS